MQATRGPGSKVRQKPVVARAAQGLVSVEWDLAAKNPPLLSALLAREPWIAARLPGLRTRPPFARVSASFRSTAYFRPVGHNRAFYFLGPSGSVLAFKGTEVLAEDAGETIRQMSWHAPLDLSPLERLARIEQKIPMALLLEEAMAEAEKACDLQAAYWRRYGSLADVPVPLLVLRWQPSLCDAFVEKHQGALSVRAQASVRRLARDGLAVYVYYYPNPPLRVRHLVDRLPEVSLGYRKRQGELARRVEIEEVVRRWIKLVVRMLGLGYFPCSPCHDEVGQCLREQNAVLDGGLVDMDSICEMASIADEGEFVETLMVTLVELLGTVHNLWVDRSKSWSPRQSRTGLVTVLLVWQQVLAELKAAMLREEEDGTVFDARVKKLLFAGASFSEVDAALALLYGRRIEKKQEQFG